MRGMSKRVHTILTAIAFAAVVITAFSFAFTPIQMSQDEWWHLKTGRWIYEHHLRPPHNDIFAYTSENIRWDNHEWMAEVGMYLLYRLGEISGYGPMRAVITAKAFIWMAALAVAGFLAWRRSRYLLPVLFIVLIASDVGRRTLQPRPPVITYLLVAIYQYFLSVYQERQVSVRSWKSIWPLLLLPLLMIAWVNLHGGFVLGGILIACHCAGNLIQAAMAHLRKNRAEAKQQWLRAGMLIITGIIVGAASLCSPFGWRLYLLAGRVMSDKQLVALIAELQSPFRMFGPAPLSIYVSQLWPYLLLAGLTLLAIIFARPRVLIGEALFALFLLWQSSLHMRHLPLFAIASIPIASPFVAQVFSLKAMKRCRLAFASQARREPAPQLALSESVATVMQFVLALFTAALAFGWLTTHRYRPDGLSFLDRSIALARGHAYRTEDYPVRLADFLEDADIRGRMFNDSRYAGYLIWRLSPERMKVFTDMRYDIFGGRFLRDEMAVRNGKIMLVDENDKPVGSLDMRTILDKYHVDVVIIDKLAGKYDEQQQVRPEWPVRLLDNSPDWTMVYRDPPSEAGLTVYLRNTPANRPMIQRARHLTPDGIYYRPGRGEWGR